MRILCTNCTIMEKSSAPFSLGGDNLKWYISTSVNEFFLNEPITMVHQSTIKKNCYRFI